MTRLAQTMSVLVVIAAVARHVYASPNVALDDPVYERLARMRALGDLPAYAGGLFPLTERRVRELLPASDTSLARLTLRGFWLRPIDRLTGRIDLHRQHYRPYSTVEKPRDIAGGVMLSCEHDEGRSCGDGAAILTEIDGSAGYTQTASLSVRLHLMTGTRDFDNEVAVERAYVNAEVGPIALEVGRDVVVLGPASRTQLGWGRNAPPLDQFRITTAQPIRVASRVRINVDYIVGQLAAPQTYPGNLVTIARGQVDLQDTVEVGMMQLLQLAGDGAPQFGLVDFLAEHFVRRDRSTSETDSSNRRIGFDVAALIKSLGGARVYYQLVFEDLRKHFHDALRYDADHLFGVELAAIGAGGKHALMLEAQTTGVRSQEHQPRVTGFTSGGRTVGSPLGPDAVSIAVQARLNFDWGTAFPSIELVRFSSDSYTFFDYGPILHTARGPAEVRSRLGARVRLPIRDDAWLDVDTKLEHVDGFSFEPSTRRNNVAISVSAVWSPNRRGLSLGN
jgi:hypothetical protein